MAGAGDAIMPAAPLLGVNEIEPHSDLVEKPSGLTTASRYTALDGVVYLIVGTTLIVWPGVVQTLFREEAFVGHEGALMRAIGLTIVVIGWLYVFGGRSGARQIVAASVMDRLVFVPLVLLPRDRGCLSPLVRGVHDTRRVARHWRMVADASQMNVFCPLSPVVLGNSVPRDGSS